jgi:hypothetical protein
LCSTFRMPDMDDPVSTATVGGRRGRAAASGAARSPCVHRKRPVTDATSLGRLVVNTFSFLNGPGRRRTSSPKNPRHVRKIQHAFVTLAH